VAGPLPDDPEPLDDPLELLDEEEVLEPLDDDELLEPLELLELLDDDELLELLELVVAEFAASFDALGLELEPPHAASVPTKAYHAACKSALCKVKIARVDYPTIELHFMPDVSWWQSVRQTRHVAYQ